jgi:hypothetical protein
MDLARDAQTIAILRCREARMMSFVLRASVLILMDVTAFFRRSGALLLILIFDVESLWSCLSR